MSAPSDLAAAAADCWFYDGAVAIKRHPRILSDANGFSLDDGAMFGPYRWEDLFALDAPAGSTLFGLRGQAGWRLGFMGAAPTSFAERAAKHPTYGSWVDRLGLRRATICFAVVAAAVVLVALRVPDWLAPRVPTAWENRLGDSMAQAITARRCHTPDGTAALRRLAGALDPDGRARRVEVLDLPLVNAVTLPGGHIFVFNGLLENIDSSDALAGVLGHELGHVRHRDGIAALMRQFGLSAVLGGFNGRGAGYSRSLLQLSYGRRAEKAADQAAIDALRRQHIDPRATAGFLATIAKEEGASVAGGWVSTHPDSAARAAAFRNSAVAGENHRPALDRPAWRSLRWICGTAVDADER
jgi:Zn-dependent protease with chaperone function